MIQQMYTIQFKVTWNDCKKALTYKKAAFTAGASLGGVMNNTYVRPSRGIRMSVAFTAFLKKSRDQSNNQPDSQGVNYSFVHPSFIDPSHQPINSSIVYLLDCSPGMGAILISSPHQVWHTTFFTWKCALHGLCDAHPSGTPTLLFAVFQAPSFILHVLFCFVNSWISGTLCTFWLCPYITSVSNQKFHIFAKYSH